MAVPCTECSKVFSVATNMYRHRRRVHGVRRTTPPTLSNRPIDHSTAPQPSKMPPLVEDSEDEDTDEPSQIGKYE